MPRPTPHTPSSPSPQGPALAGSAPQDLRAYCLRILQSGDLETKLAPPEAGLGDADPGPPVLIDRPARDPGLEMRSGSDSLPKPGQLREAHQRVACLARFAHHELQAVELFAWAILRWPELPSDLRRAWLAALVDEQRHCRLYLGRLAAHGGCFETDDHSDYFWRQAPMIAASPAGPRAFLSAMGLTLEQANLDFTLTYRDGFKQAGDLESAAVCQLVHDEEIGHVALSARWLKRLDLLASEALEESPRTAGALPEASDLELYLASVPFPLGAARAKGRRFEVKPRKRAGLSDALIEYVRLARSTAERAGAGKAPKSK